MAAAALIGLAGLAVPLVPDIIKLIASLVQRAAPAAEEQYGPGTGAVKFGAVFESVIAALQKAAVAGQIPKELPSDETVKAIIQAVVSTMQATGVLGAPQNPAPAPATQQQVITLAPGQSITIKA